MSEVLASQPHLFLGSRLKRLAEQMQTDANAFTLRAGISVPVGMFPVLATLEERGPLPVSVLANMLHVSQPAMTKNAAKLADMSLVRIDKGEADKRQSVVSLTESGHAAIDAGKATVWPLVDAAVQEITDGLSGSLIDQLDEIERRLATRSLSDRASGKAPVQLRPATDRDVPSVVKLLNHAYRGFGAHASWNSEAEYMDGERINDALLRREMADKPEATLLVWELWGALQGCVFLEPLGEGIWYLGSLAVSPHIQNAQAGRRLLTAAEDWARARGATCIRMTVVNVRDTLLAWYERRGYRLTGEVEPYPYEDGRFGTPKRPDLCFVVLDKQI